MSNSLNDLAERVAALEARTNGEFLTASTLFNAGGVDGIFMGIIFVSGGGVPIDVNTVLNNTDGEYTIHYATSSGGSWSDSGVAVPAGTYKLLNKTDAQANGVWGVALMGRFS